MMPSTRDRRWAATALGLLMASAAGTLLYAGRDRTFHHDEWTIVMERRGWTMDALLEPLNEHLSLPPVLIFKVLFETAGLDDYWAYRAILVLAHLVCVGLLFTLVRRRAGQGVALGAATLLLFLGSAWDVLLVPIGLGFVLSVAAGLGLLLALDRRDPAGRLAAALCLAMSVASSTVGFAFAAAAAVEAVRPPRRRAHWWPIAVPLGAYLAWFLLYGRTDLQQGGSLRTNAGTIPSYVADAAAGAAGGLAGVGLSWGRLLAAALIALAILQLRRGVVDRFRVSALAAAATTFWVLTALGRAHLGEPAASRYVYVGATLVLLIAADLVAGVRIRSAAGAIAALCVLAAVVANAARLQDGARFLRGWSHFVSAELAAVELAGPEARREFRPDPHRAPTLRAGPYLDAVAELGSPADSLAELRRRLEPERQSADAVLIGELGIEPRRRASVGRTAEAPAAVGSGGVLAKAGPGCLAFRPTSAGAAVELAVDEGEIWIATAQEPPAPLQIRFFAHSFPPTLWAVGGGAASSIALPKLKVDEPWRLRLANLRRPVTVCRAG